jgi:hypothetical protein
VRVHLAAECRDVVPTHRGRRVARRGYAAQCTTEARMPTSPPRSPGSHG